MPFIGNSVQNQGFAPAVDYYNGDGVTVTFTLSRPVASVAQLTAVIENVIQNPATAFTVSGNQITFTSAPPVGTNNIWVEYTSLITQYNGISQDPSVVGDITASGGYLATGDFGNSYVDGTIVDYVTGVARVTTGPLDDMTFYHGGTASRSEMMTLYHAGGAKVFGNTALTIPVGTTAQRPASPAFGMIRANSTTGYIEYYDSTAATWVGIGSFQATGGTITQYSSGGVTYQVHTFTSSGTFQVLAGTKTVDYLIVAGGGGGGGAQASNDCGGGGGGAGGMLAGSISVSPQAYTITIGAGGGGGGEQTSGSNGADSSGLGITATGGGGGAARSGGGGSTTPGNGGSGGGGTCTGLIGLGTAGQGNNGGGGAGTAAGGSYGGGGKGSTGNGPNSTGGGGNGGTGEASSITGTSLFYAGGGGGGEGNGPGGRGTGGSGVGGDGSENNNNSPRATNGMTNRGGGGGGNGGFCTGNGGNGGSGVVIIRYTI